MIFDFTDPSADTAYSADVVVIGAGAIGLIFALWLARLGKKVLLLEAGGRSLESDSQEFIREATSSGRRMDGLHAGRFSALGGTTNAWGGQLVAFDPIVFEERPWVSDAKWPFGRSELDSYYRATGELLGAKYSPESTEPLWKKLGVEAPDVGAELDLFFAQWLKLPNFAFLFHKDIIGNENLKVVTHARACAFEGVINGNVREVAFQTRSGKIGTAKAQAFVIAAGTIETVRILMSPLTNGTYPEWSSNPWLGRCFIDHIEAFVGEVRPINRRIFHDSFDNALLNGIKYSPRFKIAGDTQRDRRLVGCGAHFIYDSVFREHLGNLKVLVKSIRNGRWPRNIGEMPLQSIELMKVLFPLVARYFKSNRILSIMDDGARLRVSCEQIPIQTSSINLTQESGDTKSRAVTVNWEIDGREIKSMKFLAERIRERLWRNEIADIQLDPKLLGESTEFLDQVTDAFHQMGGARMAENRINGVVDTNCCVYGSRNMFVAGACVFPVSGFENPTFTAAALAVRLAHFLLDMI